jgi:hypothetical protein
VNIVLSTLFRLRVNWLRYLVVGLLIGGLVALTLRVADGPADAEYQVRTTVPARETLLDYGIDPADLGPQRLAAEILGEYSTIDTAGDVRISEESEESLVRLSVSGSVPAIEGGFEKAIPQGVATFTDKAQQSFDRVVARVESEVASVQARLESLQQRTLELAPEARTAVLVEAALLQDDLADLSFDLVLAQDSRAAMDSGDLGEVTRTKLVIGEVFGAPPWLLGLVAGIIAMVVAAMLAALLSQKPLTAGDVAALHPLAHVVSVPPGREPTSVERTDPDRTRRVKLGDVRRSDLTDLFLDNGDIHTIVTEYASQARYRVARALGL